MYKEYFVKAITIEEIDEYLEKYEGDIYWNKVYSKSEKEILEEFEDISKFQSFDSIVVPFNSELKAILEKEKTLNCEGIRDFCLKTRAFYIRNIFYTELKYYDYNFELNGNLFLNGCKMQVDGKDFLNLTIFGDVQRILFWGNYHLPKDERPIQDQDEYYYDHSLVRDESVILSEILEVLNR